MQHHSSGVCVTVCDLLSGAQVFLNFRVDDIFKSTVGVVDMVNFFNEILENIHANNMEESRRKQAQYPSASTLCCPFA